MTDLDRARTNVSLQRDADNQLVLRFEREYDCTIERLWQALTTAAEISIWSPWQVQLEPVVGGTITLAFTGAEPDQATITEFAPPHYFAFVWDRRVLRWQMRPAAHGCQLIFTTSVQDPSHIGQSAAGYHISLDHLADHLAGRAVHRAASPPAEPQFEALAQHYNRTLHAPASPE